MGDLCQRLERGFAGGERILWPAVYTDCFDRAAFHLASDACVDAPPRDGSAATAGAAVEWLRVRPQRGAALVFWSASAASDDSQHHGMPAEATEAQHRNRRAGSFSGKEWHPHWWMWHGGCRVWRGTKWTLQKFKEVPGTPGQ